jgi:hypothetical protein
MKKELSLTFQERIIGLLHRSIKWIEGSNQNDSPIDPDKYYSLSPTKNAEDVETYIEALEWALENKKAKDIRNIALTGSYGSGKTSILKTFQEKHKNNSEFKFLNISLATFEEELDKNPKNKNEYNLELQRLIELSILQQIFYHEEDEKIPESRFKKIKIFSQRKKDTITALAILFLTCSFIFFKFDFFAEKFNLGKDLGNLKNWLYIPSLSVMVIIGALVISKVVQVINSLKVNKLNFSNASIEIDEKISKSILNNHLDEILYFFEVTKCNTVIIEDLDRFQQTEIFTKLRELNFLLNNSKKIEKPIVFIYAVRDDIFRGDKERTKFFEFIIPVLPIVNFSNSADKLTQLLGEGTISTYLIDTVALFVDDMRLILNIANEFSIYKEKLDFSLKKEKLFSIIVYKNIHPKDFAELAENKGFLFNAIDSKQSYINEKQDVLRTEIIELKERILATENIKLKDVEELRSVYVYEFLKGLSTNDGKNFYHENEIITFNKLLGDKFNLLKADEIKYQRHNYGITNLASFQSVEQSVNPKYSYEEREKFIIDLQSNELERIKQDIAFKEKQILSFGRKKISELLHETSIELPPQNNINQNQLKLVKVLLKQAYIDEEYFDYISVFHPGSLSKADYQFLLNLKSQTSNAFDFKLNKVENLIERIEKEDFREEYILNNTLVSYILKENSVNEVKSIFSLLSTETENVFEFIKQYIANGSEVESFVKNLCNFWTNIWCYIETESNFTKDQLEKYFKLIIENSEIEDLKKVEAKSNFKEYLLDNEAIYFDSSLDKVKAISIALDVKHKLENSSTIDSDLLKFLHEKALYEINLDNLELMNRTYGSHIEENFDTKNYSHLLNSKNEFLIDYISANLGKYVENAYLKLDQIQSEGEEGFIELLNSDIPDELTSKIIDKNTLRIPNLNAINYLSVKQILLNKHRIEATWGNVFDYYSACENVFNEHLVAFLNDKSISTTLSEEMIKEDITEDDKTYRFFYMALINCSNIEKENYSNLLRSIPKVYKDWDLEDTKLELFQVEALINNDRFEYNSYHFASIESYNKGLLISFIENDINSFISYILDVDIKDRLLLEILQSSTIELPHKQQIIEKLSIEKLIENEAILRLLAQISVNYKEFEIPSEYFPKMILLDGLSDIERIKLYNSKWLKIDFKTTLEFLELLDEPYSTLAISRKRPYLPLNDLNRTLLLHLKIRKVISSYSIKKTGILRKEAYRAINRHE